MFHSKSSVFLGVFLCLALLIFPSQISQAEEPEMGTSIGIGFSFGFININLVEVSVPFSYFFSDEPASRESVQVATYERRQSIDRSHQRTTSRGQYAVYVAPPPPTTETISYELGDVVPKRVIQLKLELLFNEDVYTAPNGERIKILTDGSMKLLGSDPPVILKLHYGNRMMIWLEGKNRSIADVQYVKDQIIIGYDATNENCEALQRIFGSTFAHTCQKAIPQTTSEE